jgi:vacuolar iron transporter family protein
MAAMGDATLREPEERQRSLANLRLERDAAALYEGLAKVERDPARAAAFHEIAESERRHVELWTSRLRDAGVAVPDASRPGWRVRVTVALARVLGTGAVAELARGIEEREGRAYAGQDGPDAAAILAEEREHARTWDRLHGPRRTAGPWRAAGTTAGTTDGSTDGTTAAPGRSAEEVWHRAGQSGTLRAAVFGANDGLVSNLALVMGVAGASVDNAMIVLAGVAGLLAGAFSMGAGEYISMRSQRELFERRIELEREELRVMPEVQQAELAAIYRAKGLPEEEAQLVARRLMEDPRHALDTKLREELGIDPDALGSPWGAAIYSFLAFSIGAVIPLVPFLLGSGIEAILTSVALALGALFVVGALVSLITGRGLLFSGLRQVAIGGAAAVVTYAVGSLIGVHVGA